MENQILLNSREMFPRMILGMSLLISALFGYWLGSDNYYFPVFLIGIVFSFILMRSKTLPIIVILSASPFTGWAVEHGFLPFEILWFPEFLCGLLFLKVLAQRLARKQKFKTTGFKFVFAFLLISFYSLIYNGHSLISALLMLRVLFRYYLLFLTILNLDLNEKAAKLMNSFLIIIFLLQLPLAVVKLFIYGQGETPLGLSAHSYSTIIPLIAISFFYSFYFLYRKKALYLLGIFCFVAFSFIGGKRAFVFYFIALMIFLNWVFKKQIRLRLRTILLGVVLICVSLYFAARLLPKFNPQNKVWGEFSIKHVINFAVKYETGRTQFGTSGRISTTINVFNQLSKNGPFHLAFGFGPGGIIKSRYEGYNKEDALEKSYGIDYGNNGLCWLAIQVGYIGALIFFLFLFFFMKESYLCFQREDDPYWHSFASGMVGFTFIYLITSLFYMPFFYTDVVSAFFFYLVAIIIIRKEASQPGTAREGQQG